MGTGDLLYLVPTRYRTGMGSHSIDPQISIILLRMFFGVAAYNGSFDIIIAILRNVYIVYDFMLAVPRHPYLTATSFISDLKLASLIFPTNL